MYGGLGNDKLLGGKGADKIYGDEGNDQLYGGDDDDSIFGGTGNDFIFGGNGYDIINGEHGNDLLYGFQGENILNGGEGNDTIYGGQNDTCNGGTGNDECYYKCKETLNCEKIIKQLPDNTNFLSYIESLSTPIFLYKGYLKDSNGKPIDKTLKLKFVIYSLDNDIKWFFERYVTIASGLIEVTLGKTKKIPLNLFDGSHYISVYVKDGIDYREVRELKSVLSKNKLLKQPNTSKRKESIKQHTVFKSSELITRTMNTSSIQIDNERHLITSVKDKWTLDYGNNTKSTDLYMIPLNKESSIVLRRGEKVNSISLKEKELILNDENYGIIKNRVYEIEVDLEFNSDSVQNNQNSTQYLSEISSTSWDMVNNLCISRFDTKYGWMDVCGKKYLLKGKSVDYYTMELFSTAKSKGIWVLTEAKIEAIRRPRTAIQRWVSWSPRQDMSTSVCNSISLGVSAMGVSLGSSFNLCDEWDITKFRYPGHFKNVWKGPFWRTRNRGAEREVAFMQTVSVKSGKEAIWNIRYHFSVE